MKKNSKTFNQKQEIMSILAVANVLTDGWMTTKEIVDVANSLGWTTPMFDLNRKAMSHPYSKILSMMSDITNPKWFTDGIIVRKSESKGKKYEYKLTNKVSH